MTIASSIPTVTASLLKLLDDAVWPGGTRPQISDSDPADVGREVVIVGDTFGAGDDDQQWAALGARSRAEEYAIALVVKVLTPGLTVTQARERAFELFEVIEATLIENVTAAVPSTANLEIHSIALRQPTHRQGPLAEGQGCVIESAVRVRAKLKR